MKLRIASLLVTVSLLATAAFAQNPATQGSASGRYGLSAWAINNQRVASLFNYDIDSAFGSGLANLTFPQMTCQQALAFGGNKNVNPFNTNATVKIVDLTSANTETVALNSAPSLANGNGTLSLANSNAHFSYHLRSGTCGLKEAQNDKGGNAGTIIVDQKFYDDGCTASTITALVGGVSGDVVQDISNGQSNLYGWNGANFVLISQVSSNHLGFGNVDVVGTKTLAAGAGTVTFVKSFTNAPLVFCTDTTAAAAVKCSATTTAITIAGTGTDVIAYLVIGSPN
jgi:hypothetical protein